MPRHPSQHTAKGKEDRFTSYTKVYLIPNMAERAIPFFPPFIPCDQVWEFTLDNDVYLDIIGMVLYVSSVDFVNCLYNRRIPVRKVVLMDGRFNIVTIVVKDRLVSGNLVSWDRSVDERSIVVVTMLRAKPIEHTLHTTVFSRVHFDPDIAVAHEMRRRINNDLSGSPSSWPSKKKRSVEVEHSWSCLNSFEPSKVD